MSEHDDPETRKSFEALRRSVEPTVDVDSGLAELHQRRRGRPRRFAFAASLGAAAVVAALVVGGIALLGDEGQQVVSSSEDGVEGSTTTTVEPEACRDQEVFVYLEPDASPEQLDGVAAALERDEGVEQVVFMDREATYAEFLELFADQPDFVQAIRPEELPPSYRVTRSEEPTDAQVSAWESMPGVLRVEFPDQYLCEVQRSGAGVTAGYRVHVDGEPVDPDMLRGSILSAREHGGEEVDAQDVERYGAAGAVLRHLLIEHGRDIGPQVSDAEIDDAILDADSLGYLDQPGTTIAPEDALTDPAVRASVSAMLYRTRGLAAVLDETTGPAALDSWFRDRLAETVVDVRTPSGGSMTDEEIARYGVGPAISEPG